jgi:thioredoxin 1
MGFLLTAVIGTAIGAALGGLVGLLVRTSDKAWAFISTPRRGIAVGAVAGLVLAIYFATPTGWHKGNVTALTVETFDETIGGDKPVVVDFTRDGCPPCNRIAPRMERLADEFDGRVVVAKVDTTAQPALADRFHIRVVPTIIYFAGGEVVDAAEGALSYGELRERVEALLGEHKPTVQTPAPENPPE